MYINPHFHSDGFMIIDVNNALVCYQFEVYVRENVLLCGSAGMIAVVMD